MWVDQDFSGDDAAFVEDGREPGFAFIKALPSDNPYLDASYWRQLDTLPPRMRRAFRDGDWNIFEGQAFSEWREDLHVCAPFPVPKDWTKWVAVDYGYAAPFCALWFAMPPDKSRIYVYRELYETGWRAARQGKEIRARDKQDGNVRLHVGDPSMWQRKQDESGDTIADEFAREGVVLFKANNRRDAGMGYVREALAWRSLPTERVIKEPRLQVFSTCRNLIRTLPALPFDEIRVEDVDTDAEDHAYDALRYGLAVERQRPKGQRGKAKRGVHASRERVGEEKPGVVKRWMGVE